MTRLRDFDVGSDSRFVLDLGLFHDELTDEQRGAIGRKVSTVAAPGATLPTAAWAPGRRGPLPRGAGPGGTGRAWKSRIGGASSSPSSRAKRIRPIDDEPDDALCRRTVWIELRVVDDHAPADATPGSQGDMNDPV